MIMIVMAIAIAAYILRKLPNKKSTAIKKELEGKLQAMKENAIKYRVPVDEMERTKLEKRIKELSAANFNFDATDFGIFLAAFMISLYLTGLSKPRAIVIFVLNIMLYGSGLFWGACIFYRSRLKKEVTMGAMNVKDRKLIYEQMVLKNPEYKKLNMMCDIILPSIVILAGIISQFMMKH